MKVNVYRVSYHTVTLVAGLEVRRTSPVSVLVAAVDHNDAARLLPVKAAENKGERNSNVVITCQPIHSGVLAAERKSLDEALREGTEDN